MEYTVFWTQVTRSGNCYEGETTLWAESEAEAEERFYITHKKLSAVSINGYEIRRIMSEEE